MSYFDDSIKKIKKDIKYRSDCISKATIEINFLKEAFDKYRDSPDRFFLYCEAMMEYNKDFVEEEKVELKALNERLSRYKDLAK